MSGRAATVNVIAGDFALAVGHADIPAPPGWRWVPLTDIARLESGHTPSREHPEYWGGDVPWIGIKDARTNHGRTINETFQTVTSDGIENSAARILPTGTVCLSRTASVGYVVIMGREMATSQDFVNWVCGPELEPTFLQKLLIAENKALFRFGKGTTHTTIYYPEVKAFYVCLPPRKEQRRIVAKLDALQARSRRARAALETVPVLLEKLRQSILAAAFRGDLTKDWRAKNKNVEPASDLLKRIRIERRKKWDEAELAKMKAKGKPPTDDGWKARYEEPEPVDMVGTPALPEGWCVVKLGEVVSRLTNGYVGPTRDIYADKGIPYLLSKHVKKNVLRFDNETFVTPAFNQKNQKSILKSGDVLLVQTGHVGESAVVPPEHAGHNCHAMIVITPVPRVLDGHYLSLFFGAPITQRAFGAIEKGMTLRHLNCHDVIQLPTIVPPIEEQREIVARVGALLARIGGLATDARQHLDAIKVLDRAALAKAFRGELVPLNAEEESADAMLARLRGNPTELSSPPSKTRSRPVKEPA